MSNVPELEFVSWSRFHKLCFEMAKKLEADRLEFDTIVSISRGGHVISRVLSDFLDLSIFNVSIQSYKSFKRQELRLTQKLGQYLDRQKVLLVDEIVDTGKSLNRANQYLSRVRAKTVFSVAMHVKPHAQPKPDLFVVETENWVVYPYEVYETIVSLKPVWGENGWGRGKITKQLTAGGFSEEQVEFFLAKAGVFGS